MFSIYSRTTRLNTQQHFAVDGATINGKFKRSFIEKYDAKVLYMQHFVESK